MNLIKISMLSLLLAFSFSMTGCQGNNSDAPVATTPGTDTTAPDDTVPVVDTNDSTSLTIVLPVSATVLKTNSQVVNIDVKMFDASNNPYSEGIVTKTNPRDVLTGRDIGSFDKDSSTLVNGVAHFVYTAPENLDANTSNIYFSFYHESNTSDARIYTMSIVPEVNQTILTNYKLVASNADDKDMDLNSNKSISYSLSTNSDELVSDSQITSLKVTSLNPSLATLQDSKGNSGVELESTDNSYSINAISNTKSGLVPIKVEATFLDVNGNQQTVTEIFEIVVLSGPPTASSLGYISSAFDAESGLYTENWRLTVTDKYSNLVNSNPSVSSGLIVGFAQSSGTQSNAGNYLYYSPTPGGALSQSGTKGKFVAPSNAFDNVDLVNDELALFGTGYTFGASGLWDIDTASSNTLNLGDDYNDASVSGLGFAVGHNLRNETCNGDATVAQVYPADGNILDDSGSMILKIEFSDYLVGKSLVLWTNFLGGANNITQKLGYAKKITLVGTGLETGSFTVTKGTTVGDGKVYVYVKDSPHGRVYLNSNFSYTFNNSAQDTNVTITGSSMDAGILDCTNGGAAFVKFNIPSVAGGTGEITLTDLRINNEF